MRGSAALDGINAAGMPTLARLPRRREQRPRHARSLDKALVQRLLCGH